MLIREVKERDRNLLAVAIFELWTPEVHHTRPTKKQIKKLVNEFHKDEAAEAMMRKF